MIYLSLSIICSVTVGVLLKIAKRYQINVFQAVTWNYLFAIALSLFFFKPELTSLSLEVISPVYVVLGILLPIIFIVQGKAVAIAGLARTDIAQRLSLFISMCAAFFLFKEDFTVLKYTGLAFGILAIIFTLYRNSPHTSSSSAWLYLLLVFLGFGFIDVLFKLLSQQIAYTTSLFLIFCIAFILSLSFLIYRLVAKGVKLKAINFICGCILGFFNFGNILFYLKAHRSMAESPFIVFAAMNMGVIIIGSLIGILVFKEKLSKMNYFGLFLALVAIVLITLSKFYAFQ